MEYRDDLDHCRMLGGRCLCHYDPIDILQANSVKEDSSYNYQIIIFQGVCGFGNQRSSQTSPEPVTPKVGLYSPNSSIH